MSQLENLRLFERALVEDFTNKARDIKNRLRNTNETVADKHVNQLVLNELPRWESTVQTLTHLNATIIFDELIARLHAKANRRELHNAQLQEEKALVTTFGKKAIVSQPENFIPFRGRRRGIIRGRFGYTNFGRGSCKASTNLLQMR